MPWRCLFPSHDLRNLNAPTFATSIRGSKSSTNLPSDSPEPAANIYLTSIFLHILFWSSGSVHGDDLGCFCETRLSIFPTFLFACGFYPQCTSNVQDCSYVQRLFFFFPFFLSSSTSWSTLSAITLGCCVCVTVCVRKKREREIQVRSKCLHLLHSYIHSTWYHFWSGYPSSPPTPYYKVNKTG